MLTMEGLTLDRLREIGGADYKLRQGNLNQGSWSYGYRIAQNQDIQLHYVVNNSYTVLESGAVVNKSDGYMISQTSPNGRYQIGLAFYDTTGLNYSDISDATKEAAIDDYNFAIQGGAVSTDIESDNRTQTVNERGETIAEQREREAAETAQNREDEQTRLNEIEIVSDEVDVITVTNDGYILQGSEGASISKRVRFVIVQKTTGTVATPRNEFMLYQVQWDADPLSTTYGTLIDSRYVEWNDSQNPHPTLESANQSAQNRLESLRVPFEKEESERYRELYENQTKTEIIESATVFFKPSDLSFRQMALDDSFDYTQTAFRKGREGEERVGGSIYTGNYGDAVKWSNNGNTLELVDFDTPRVTTAGITENKSGGIAFTVKQGWKVEFTLKSNSLTFTLNSESELEGSPIVKEGNSFKFTMIGGDRIEIDIDNEREGVYPFLVTSNGYIWESNSEIDDEVFLTMNSASKLSYIYTKSEVIEYVNPPREGEIKSETVLESIEGKFIMNSETGLIDGLNENQTVVVNQEIDSYQRESLTFTRNFGITDIEAESSFVSPEDVTPDVGSLVPDNWQVWLIGGVVAVGAFILLAVFINARARRGGE